MIAAIALPIIRRLPEPLYRTIFLWLIRYVPAGELDALLDLLNGPQM